MHACTFCPSEIESYERCSECGTLKRTDTVDPNELYGTGYWDRQNHSTLEDQVYNMTEFRNELGESKVESILKYAEGGDVALEIACAPGSLLKTLCEKYNQVGGIEYDYRYDERIRNVCGVKPWLLFGMFPYITKPGAKAFLPDGSCDFICGCDILEHSEGPEGFIKEVHRLLKPTGTAVLMGPFLWHDGQYREQDRHIEHRHLLSQQWLEEIAAELFCEYELGRWVIGHEYIVLRNPR